MFECLYGGTIVDKTFHDHLITSLLYQKIRLDPLRFYQSGKNIHRNSGGTKDNVNRINQSQQIKHEVGIVKKNQNRLLKPNSD